MPGYSCSIKERMLYSSCKNGLVESLEQKGIEVHKKVSQSNRRKTGNLAPVQQNHPQRCL